MPRGDAVRDITEDGRPAWLAWWPVVIGPLALASVWTASSAGWDGYLAKRPQEVLAICLMSVAVLACVGRAWTGRNPAHLLLAGLSVAFLLREIHWDWTTKGVYVGVAGLMVWAGVWRKRLRPAMHVGRFWQWLCATGATYVLAQLIARRAFRGVLPNEAELHVAYEEVIENAAHLMLIVTAFAGRFGKRDDRRTPEQLAA
jgi:hypothetical protein